MIYKCYPFFSAIFRHFWRAQSLLILALILALTLPAISQSIEVRSFDSKALCIQGDCANGLGTLLFPDRTAYRGGFLKSLANGNGTWFFGDGTAIEAEWHQGLPQDQIVLFRDGLHYNLEWKNGRLFQAESDIVFSIDRTFFSGQTSFEQEAIQPALHSFQQDLYAAQTSEPYLENPAKEVTSASPVLEHFLEHALSGMVNDTIFPGFEITQPAFQREGVTHFPFETLFIEGTASDNAGIAWVRINGFDAELYFPKNQKSVHFAGSIGLRTSGVQQILIEAADIAGNISRQTHMIRYDENAEVDQSYIARKTRLSPPRIYITHPVDNEAPIEAPESFINVRGYVVAFQGVNTVFVNGVAASLDHPGAVKTNFNARVPVMAGSNELSIAAIDGSGRRSTDALDIKVSEAFDGQLNNLHGHNWILAIAIDEYAHWRPLNNAVRDVERAIELLTGRYHFSEERVVRLFNQDADYNSIQKALEDLNRAAGPDDQVLVLFSGHGDYDPSVNAGFWVPADGKPNDRKSYLSNSALQEYLRKFNARHVLVVADACFSGSILSEQRGFVNQVGRYKSRRALVSGRLEPVSDGAAGFHSPFSEAVISYLQQNTRSAFASSQLEQFVKITVANLHQQTPLNGVIMNTGDRGGEFVFRLR